MGGKRVRIHQRERVAVRIRDLELVAQAAARRRRGSPSNSAAGWRCSSATGSPPSGRASDALGGGTEGAHDHAPVAGMGAEQRDAGRACSRADDAARRRVISRRHLQQPHDARHRDAHPVRAVVQLVAQLVHRLLELEDGQQLLHPVAARRQQRRVGGVRGRRRGTRRAPAPPSPPAAPRRAGSPTADAAYANERIMPATSRSGERLRRRSGSARAGSPSKSSTTQPRRARMVWPEVVVAVGADHLARRARRG